MSLTAQLPPASQQRDHSAQQGLRSLPGEGNTETGPVPVAPQAEFTNLKHQKACQFGATDNWKQGVSSALQELTYQARLLEALVEKDPVSPTCAC